MSNGLVTVHSLSSHPTEAWKLLRPSQKVIKIHLKDPKQNEPPPDKVSLGTKKLDKKNYQVRMAE